MITLAWKRPMAGRASLSVTVCIVSIPLHTTLQAVAVRHRIGCIVLCYLQHLSFTDISNCRRHLVRLIFHLPTPFVLLGDFNAKHVLCVVR
jgi:hypothetical protein